MIDKWLTSNEIAQLLSLKKPRPIQVRAKKEAWPYRSYAVRGGKERRYHLANLPEDVQTAYAASIKTSLEDLWNQLKPALKTEKKIDIPRYSGRGANWEPLGRYPPNPACTGGWSVMSNSASPGWPRSIPNGAAGPGLPLTTGPGI
jgi:hypothetical protein